MVANPNQTRFESHHNTVVVRPARMAVTEDRLLDYAAIEAIGSLNLLEETGWFDGYHEAELASLRAMAPASRGGAGFGLEQEIGWLRIVEQLQKRFGHRQLETMKQHVQKYIENHSFETINKT